LSAARKLRAKITHWLTVINAFIRQPANQQTALGAVVNRQVFNHNFDACPPDVRRKRFRQSGHHRLRFTHRMTNVSMEAKIKDVTPNQSIIFIFLRRRQLAW
jgi:hypothetical protein